MQKMTTPEGSLAQGHRASQGQSWGLNCGLLILAFLFESMFPFGLT